MHLLIAFEPIYCVSALQKDGFHKCCSFLFFLLVLSIKSLREISIIVNTRKTNDHQLFLIDNKSNVSTFKYIFTKSTPVITKKPKYCRRALASHPLVHELHKRSVISSYSIYYSCTVAHI